MVERQRHGFDCEQYLLNEYPLFVPQGNGYTSQWDAVVEASEIISDNNVVPNFGVVPVSIKTKRLGTNIEMADLMRNAMCETGFLLCVGFWEKSSSKFVIREDYTYIPHFEWKSQFDLTIAQKMRDIFIDNNITNSRSDDARWRKISRNYRQKWKETGSGINVLFKRDHKNQRRVQCSISKDLYKRLREKYTVDLRPR